MNRILLIIAFLCSPVVKGSDEDLILNAKDTLTESTYDLVVSEGGKERVIWTKTIPKVDGKIPFDWCKLIASDRNDQGMIAFLERNLSRIGVWQFDANGQLIAELETPDPKWLANLGYGGRVSVVAPDKITVDDGKEKSEQFIFSNGKVVDERGRPIKNRLNRIGGKTDERRETKRPGKDEVAAGGLEKMPEGAGDNPDRSTPTQPAILPISLAIGALAVIFGGGCYGALSEIAATNPLLLRSGKAGTRLLEASDPVVSDPFRGFNPSA